MLVGLDEEICPHCRAPRDDMEMEEGRELVRQEELRLKRRPKRIAAGAAGLLILCLAWSARARISGSLAAAWRDFAAEVERTRDPRRYAAADPQSAAAPAPAAATAGVPNETVISSFVYLVGGAPPVVAPSAAAPANSNEASETISMAAEAEAPAAIAAAAPVPTQPGGPFRRFYGIIYDIDTLKPLGGVKVWFRLKGNDVGFTTTSNNQGHFQIEFFNGADSGLWVSAEVPGYRPGLLEDKDPPLFERTHAARQSIKEELIEGDLDPFPLRFRESTDLVELNLVVVPRAEK